MIESAGNLDKPAGDPSEKVLRSSKPACVERLVVLHKS
jgi:hypothetical protein